MVRTARLGHRLLHPDAAHHPHLHLASRRCGPHAGWAVHRLYTRRLHSLGPDARDRRARGRRSVGRLERQSALRRLRGGGGDRGCSCLPGDQAPARERSVGADAPGVSAQPSTPPAEVSPARAAALGAIQGPAELLPISSSAHLSLVPWLAGWRWHELDPETRKSFEVALHAGAAAALLIGQRQVIADELRAFDARRAAVVALSFVPPAIAGYGLERQIEGRLGGPLATAVGLLAGSAAMVIADRKPQERGPGDATAVDGLALGL